MQIAIIGTGLVGRLLAFSLSQQLENKITLFDKAGPQGENSAAMTAAGMISPCTELEKSPALIYEMGIASLKLWPELIKKLDKPVYFQNRGTLVTAHSNDSAELTQFIGKINHASIKVSYEYLRGEELKKIEPALCAESCYYFPNEGQIDSQNIMIKLGEYLQESNIEWKNVEIDKPSELKNEYDFIFDCRGVGGNTLYKDLRGIRGEVVWLQTSDIHFSRPIRYLHPRYSIYIVPRPNNIFIIGASEIEAEDYSPISLRSMMELLSAAYQVNKGFLEARIIKTATNCRPTLSDHLPKIKSVDNIIAINGLYRHGYTLAPVLVEEVMCYIKSGSQNLRFPTLWEKINDYNYV